MKMEKGYIEKQYCTGCGLCKSYFGSSFVNMHLNEQGFYQPEFHLSDQSFEELKHFCPVDALPNINQEVWGTYCSVSMGHAQDTELRERASSGGILSALCIYILDHNLADGIIQLGDSSNPLQKKTMISRTTEEIVSCAGSRYIASMPLEQVINFLRETDEKYVLVGRPCDIRAMRAFIETHKEYQHRIVWMLSFFCAGTPSINASKKMIAKMGADMNAVTFVSYRGNGWPGFSTVKERDGKTYTMTYEDSWGTILGRDIYRGCRFCYDGVGEQADISCGDAWYLNTDGSISFDERPGRNVIFARTAEGEQLLRKAAKESYITCQNFNITDLKKMQPYQSVRKGQLYYKLLAMRTAKHLVPKLNMKALSKYKYQLETKHRIKIYLGTLRRIIQKKI